MATKLDDIYRSFLSLIEDKEYLLIDESVLNDLMLTYLESSIASFNMCRKSLEINGNEFVENLSFIEKKILSRGMLLDYLNPKIIREENLTQTVTTKDYTNNSNANMLAKLIELRKVIKEEYEELISDYDYNNFEGLN